MTRINYREHMRKGKYPNLHADLSAGSGLNAMSRDLEYAREFLGKHYRKLLFGTDRFVEEEEPLIIELIKNMHLPKHAEEAIFQDNAMKMLRLPKVD